MELSKQVCSLELAKKLKELGVPQTAWWSWYDATDRDDTPALNRSTVSGSCPSCGFPKAPWDEEVSAFTVAELGEMLPIEYISQRRPHGSIGAGQYQWHAGKYDTDYSVEADTEADARAKMLVYLLENKLIQL